MTSRSPSGDYSEDTLVEQPAIALFDELGWTTANLYHETFGVNGTEGRESEHEVILPRRLKAALKRLNPELPGEALDAAFTDIVRDRSTLSSTSANHEFYLLLKNGVTVTYRDADGQSVTDRVRVIDWSDPSQNDFFLASQFWISGDLYRRRADLIGFVNGIPLVFIELKASHKHLKNAYSDNLRDYRDTIPQVFIPNAFILLSNGSHTRIGSLSAAWEHCFEWKRINDEGETGLVSLETALRGLCEKTRLLDYVENFTLFEEVSGGLVKKIAKNHQFLGVNKVYDRIVTLREQQGRLGVFWHTQGSGKSLSMAFLTQKVLRRLLGQWTFVVVTDRDELDTQLYKTFVATGAFTGTEAHARNGQHLKQLLTEDHRYVFTLIQKFHTKNGEAYPLLSERHDIIVITDEAHRSQYDTFALNMRTALPNAAFLGFTGTPLISGEEEKTREVFGDYVSVYDFQRSIADGATVPLYYENRIPELQLTNDNLNDDMAALLEAAELDEEQERLLERQFAREYHLITREDRLEAIAKDLVQHFTGRGYRGKAMMVCIDKATAVRMYDKVRAHWQASLATLRVTLASQTAIAEQAAPYRTGERVTGDWAAEQAALAEKIAYMESTDMAVIVSQAQNEVADLKAKGLDITPHRQRLVNENLDEAFKDETNPLRLVFVCAMWITGFDVPSCSTIYLDKPMKNHTLMQTIARANRVAPGKAAGLIVDYVGIFRSLQKALAIYARQGSGGGELPIKNKQALVDGLREALIEARAFCRTHGIDLDAIRQAEGFARIGKLDDAVEALLVSDDVRKRYLSIASRTARIYKAILPDTEAKTFAPDTVLLAVIASKIRSLSPKPDISEIMDDVEALLNNSIATEPYRIEAQETPAPLIDLSQINFEKLAKEFETSRKRTEAEKLQAILAQKIDQMLRENRSRLDFLEKFQQMIAEYNAGSQNIEVFFDKLVTFAQSLSEEDQRGMAERLTAEELAIFDILTKPEPELSPSEREAVKKVARTLLETLKREKLVLDWREKQQARAGVRKTITRTFSQALPASYTPELRAVKSDLAYCHIFDSYVDGQHSIYVQAA
jgi:type I restriction enzyme, R subunit